MTSHRPRARVAPGAEMADVLAAALRDQGRSLTWLRERLRARGIEVSLSALSYWRSGERRPEGAASHEAITVIEELLELAPGALGDRIGPSRRAGVRARTAHVGEIVDSSGTDALARALDDLGLADAPSRTLDEAASFTVDLDERGCFGAIRSRLRIRALAESVERIPLWFLVDRKVPEPLRLADLRGAVPARRVDDLTTGLVVQEVLLERPLASGEATVVEATFEVPQGDDRADTEFVLSPPRRISEIELWVRFDRAQVPASCTLRSAELGGTSSEVGIDLSAVTGVHHAVRGFGPGTVGVHWTW
ncbi:hypothetical protein [Pimelobacter simplex]|uniref:hypothetical protein n=1 Tax=Nocardioides simplex TaxID=2045 RepID=UPI003AAA7B5F